MSCWAGLFLVSYTVQEYFITGPSELFTEIGGLMGLLLGWSILGKLQYTVKEYFITGSSELFAEIGGLIGLLLVSYSTVHSTGILNH